MRRTNPARPLSESGQSRRLRNPRLLPLTLQERRNSGHGGTHTVCHKRLWAIAAKLFHHLVGTGGQFGRHFEAERAGRYQIDDELELGGLYDRKVGGLRTLKYLTAVQSDLTKTVSDVGTVAHQPADFDELTTPISCRNPVARRQGRKLDAAADEERVAADKEGVGMVPHNSEAVSISRLVLALRT